MTQAALDLDVYIAAIRVDEMFADLSYQRDVDTPEERARIRKMHAQWSPRLLGVLEVSDRGEESTGPRYAIVDGHHRWSAACMFDNPPALVANVHTGLTVADEAALFDKLNRERKSTNTWDHWRARRAAADPFVASVEATAARVGLTVAQQAKDGNVRCIGALEKVAKSGPGLPLLKDTLQVLHDTWGKQFDAYDAPLVSGMAMLLNAFDDDRVQWDRLVDGLIDLPPRRVKYVAQMKRDTTSGSLAKLVGLTMLERYNQVAQGGRLTVPPTFGSLRAAPKPKAVRHA
ncbi:hypothetical protein H7K45_27905 [Mycobacterium yunnanensis]|uniref:ParB-like nuclease domain-containing protein n=1 Tax=Mycobacterium yunnanensis TaxID=368477 RepID=A0A9X2ZA46_9MYCO|nr:DUF6551 family protein [Mycobacterium yunnanensis]MCV7424376.1 hypothetical protein [Mycobacterium yunnanensis]